MNLKMNLSHKHKSMFDLIFVQYFIAIYRQSVQSLTTVGAKQFQELDEKNREKGNKVVNVEETDIPLG